MSSYIETFDKDFLSVLQFLYQRYYEDRVPENRESYGSLAVAFNIEKTQNNLATPESGFENVKKANLAVSSFSVA